MLRKRMKIESIDVEATIENTKKLLENDAGVSPALKSAIELLLALLCNNLIPRILLKISPWTKKLCQ